MGSYYGWVGGGKTVGERRGRVCGVSKVCAGLLWEEDCSFHFRNCRKAVGVNP